MIQERRKLRLLHLIEDLGSGGAERLLYTNLKHFDRDEIENAVVTIFAEKDYWKSPIEELGVRVNSLACTGLSDFPRSIRELRRRIEEFRPEIIHTHLWAANIIGRIGGKITNVPVISSIHNPEYAPEASENVRRVVKGKIQVARGLDALTARVWCDRMIAVSRFVKESTTTAIRYPAERVEVLYNPIDESAFEMCSSTQLSTGDLGLPDDAIVILNVGRVSPQKGLIYAVRAMPAIIKVQPKALLVSVGAQGDQSYLNELKAEIDKLDLRDSVHLLGERRNVRDYLNTCKLFVFPSLFEGLGIALAEAMAAGRACLASNIKPFDEFIENNFNGVLSEVRDPQEFSEVVMCLLADPDLCARLGEEARRTATELFRPERAAERLIQIYRSVAGGLQVRSAYI